MILIPLTIRMPVPNRLIQEVPIHLKQILLITGMDISQSITCKWSLTVFSSLKCLINLLTCVHSTFNKSCSDLKIPSEHSICGKKFPAELSIYLLHPLRRQTVAMSILMDFDPSDNDNQHFQKVIDKWQQVFDANNSKCTPLPPPIQSRKFFNNVDIIGDLPSFITNAVALNTSNHYDNETTHDANNGTHRVLNGPLVEEGVWDPFHPSMERVSFSLALDFLLLYVLSTFLTEPPIITIIRVFTTGATGDH